MNLKPLKEEIIPAPAEQVRFIDGMLVTAEDLDAAMRYPMDVFRMLTKSFFGCGIVCGLDVDVPNENGDYVVTISPGVALDCHGDPIQLCKAISLDLQQDHCQAELTNLVIAIRRTTSSENPRPMDECATDQSSANYQCTRLQEQVWIKVFNADDLETLPKTLCESDGTVTEQDFCQCLKQCPGGHCCGNAWVVLERLKYVKTQDENGDNVCYLSAETPSHRKYVKPVRCACQFESDLYRGLNKREQDLSKRIEALEKKLGKPGTAPQVNLQQAKPVQQTEISKPEVAKPATEVTGTAVKAAQTAPAEKAAQSNSVESKATETKATSVKSTTKKTTDKK